MDPQGMKALVTGGSRGIGAATCTLLANAGVDVCVNFYRAAAEAEAVAARCRAAGVRATTLQGDVSRVDECRRAVTTAAQQLGGLDILINNAGAVESGNVETIDEDEWNRVVDLSLKGYFFCVQAALPYLKRSGKGRVVNLSSLAGKRGTAPPHYAAAKAGVMGLTMSLALQLAPYGITVNSVYPGLIATDFGAGRENTLAAGAAPGAVPLGRAGTPEDVADAILFLVRSDYITGEHINLTGGRFMTL